MDVHILVAVEGYIVMPIGSGGQTAWDVGQVDVLVYEQTVHFLATSVYYYTLSFCSINFVFEPSSKVYKFSSHPLKLEGDSIVSLSSTYMSMYNFLPSSCKFVL